MILAPVVLAAGLAAGIPTPTPTPTSGPAPARQAGAGLVVENMTVKVGEIRPGGVAEGTFVFRNTGDRAVKILRAAPS